MEIVGINGTDHFSAIEMPGVIRTGMPVVCELATFNSTVCD